MKTDNPREQWAKDNKTSLTPLRAIVYVCRTCINSRVCLSQRLYCEQCPLELCSAQTTVKDTNLHCMVDGSVKIESKCKLWTDISH